jgi:hypothetical protein
MIVGDRRQLGQSLFVSLQSQSHLGAEKVIDGGRSPVERQAIERGAGLDISACLVGPLGARKDLVEIGMGPSQDHDASADREQEGHEGAEDGFARATKTHSGFVAAEPIVKSIACVLGAGRNLCTRRATGRYPPRVALPEQNPLFLGRLGARRGFGFGLRFLEMVFVRHVLGHLFSE